MGLFGRKQKTDVITTCPRCSQLVEDSEVECPMCGQALENAATPAVHTADASD